MNNWLRYKNLHQRCKNSCRCHLAGGQDLSYFRIEKKRQVSSPWVVRFKIIIARFNSALSNTSKNPAHGAIHGHGTVPENIEWIKEHHSSGWGRSLCRFWLPSLNTLIHIRPDSLNHRHSNIQRERRDVEEI